MSNTAISKVREIWELVELVVQESIKAAEVIYGPKTGPEKKAYVVNEGIRFLTELEAKYNLLPGMAEGVVLTAVKFALEQLVERLVKQTPTPATA